MADVDNVTFEVLKVEGEGTAGRLIVRFTLDGRHTDLPVTWDGRGDFIRALEKMAAVAVPQIGLPPPPTAEQLQPHVGRHGNINVPRVPPPVVGPPVLAPPPPPAPGSPMPPGSFPSSAR